MATRTPRPLAGTRATTLGVLALLIVVSAGAFAWNIARADDHGQIIDACIDPAGDVRIIEDGEACRNNESPVSWNQQGPQGEPGEPGEPGTVDVNITSDGPTTASLIGFLEIDGIPGESSAEGHQGEIDIFGVDFGISRSTTIGTGGGAGKANFSELTITKKTDSASTPIMLAAANGLAFPEVVIAFPHPDADGDDYLHITLTGATIAGYEVTQDGTRPLPVELVSFHYQEIEVEYRELLADGSFGPPSRFGWDVAGNTSN